MNPLIHCYISTYIIHHIMTIQYAHMKYWSTTIFVVKSIKLYLHSTCFTVKLWKLLWGILCTLCRMWWIWISFVVQNIDWNVAQKSEFNTERNYAILYSLDNAQISRSRTGFSSRFYVTIPSIFCISYCKEDTVIKEVFLQGERIKMLSIVWNLIKLKRKHKQWSCATVPPYK